MPSYSMPDTDLPELVAAYALDALDDDEREEFERHLGTCERCADELAGLREAAASLAYAIPSTPLPTALRERILDSARAERPNVVPLRRRWSTPALGTVAAVAAVVAIGLGIWNISLSHSIDDKDAELAANAKAFEIVGDPNAARHSLTGADGSLIVARSGDGALVVCGLDSAPADKTYEAWVIAGKRASRAGVFDSDRPCLAVPLTTPVPRDGVVGVTIERKGGVDAPTQAPFITSKRA
jgi:anti-sigma factor RsiW